MTKRIDTTSFLPIIGPYLSRAETPYPVTYSLC